MLLRNWKGVFASATFVVALAVVTDGCSSGSSSTSDGDAAAEASHPPRRFDASFDAGAAGDGGDDSSAGFDGTTGQTCMTDTDCSPKGLGINKCTIANFFVGGPIFPTPVCMPAAPCNSGADQFIHYCDGPDVSSSKGVCVPSSTTPGSGTCFPKCVIFPDGSAPSGCQGKDTCELLAWGLSASGQPLGIGRCFGGCTADTDCPTGSKCQTDEGVCLTTTRTATKHLGQTCSVNDPVGTCGCFSNTSTGIGYCTQFCITGPSSPAPCPSGYTCDSQLPSEIMSSTTDASVTGFTMQNVGLAGSCLQSCGPSGGADAAVESGPNAPIDSSSDAIGEGGSEGGSDAGSDAGGSGQTPPTACPVTAACSTKDTAGPVCIP